MNDILITLSNKFCEIKNSPEHPIYHPEGFLGNHIMLVTLKAFLWTNNPDFIWTGLLHDLFKADESFKSRWVELPEGTYWSNPLHPKQAKDFIEKDDGLKYFILQTGGDWRNVADLCYWHMAAKNGTPKNARLVSGLSFFPCLDDMINRFTMPEKHLKNVFFPGVEVLESFILTDYKILKDKFFLIGENCHYMFEYNEIPLFFSNSEKWDFLKDIFEYGKAD